MGRTATTTVEVQPSPRADSGVRRGRASTEEGIAVLLETDEIILRTTPRRVLLRAAIASPRVEGEALAFEHDQTTYRLHLGAKEAAKWVDALLHPKSRLDKLGVSKGLSVAAIGALDAGFLAELAGALGAPPKRRLGDGHAIVFLGVETRKDLEALSKAKGALAAKGAIWIIRPKGKPLPKEAPAEVDVREACRAEGLVDLKVARFSDTHTAEKYCPRKG